MRRDEQMNREAEAASHRFFIREQVREQHARRIEAKPVSFEEARINRARIASVLAQHRTASRQTGTQRFARSSSSSNRFVDRRQVSMVLTANGITTLEQERVMRELSTA